MTDVATRSVHTSVKALHPGIACLHLQFTQNPTRISVQSLYDEKLSDNSWVAFHDVFVTFDPRSQRFDYQSDSVSTWITHIKYLMSPAWSTISIVISLLQTFFPSFFQTVSKRWNHAVAVNWNWRITVCLWICHTLVIRFVQKQESRQTEFDNNKTRYTDLQGYRPTHVQHLELSTSAASSLQQQISPCLCFGFSCPSNMKLN